ncbi:hypothetical protein RFI_10165, partial [Reticulomyxa filosa]
MNHKDVKAEDISIVPSVSFGSATIAKNLSEVVKKHWKEKGTRGNVVLLRDQYPSNYYVWKRMQEQLGENVVEIRVVERPSFKDSWTQYVLQCIDSDTILVTIPNVHWSDGSWVGIEEISRVISKKYKPKCHLVLDCTQSMGVVPFPEN